MIYKALRAASQNFKFQKYLGMHKDASLDWIEIYIYIYIYIYI